MAEQQLEAKLEAAEQGTPEYCSLLSDLAELKLHNGKAAEAQELYKELQQQRQADLEQQPEEEVPPEASSSSEDWDDGEWTPPLLRTASSFERHAHSAATTTQPQGKPPSASKQQQPQQPQPTPPPPQQQATAQRGKTAADSWRAPAATRWRSPAGEGDNSRASTPGLPTDNAHVVEIYRLQRSVKTSHLEDYLAEWAWAGCGPTIRWVDDAHALAVFPCAEAAQALLDSDQERYAVRPYCKASEQAREVPPEELQPPRTVRPKTTTAVARRLIGAALGTSAVRDRDAERELRAMRQEKKQERQQRQQQLQEAWEEG